MINCLCLACDRANSITTKFCTQCGAKLQIQDRYRALKVIGQGGFGKTFLAQDEGKPSQPRCVIKQFIYDDPATLREAQRLFEQEAVRLDDLGKHNQIPELLAHCEQEGRQYLVQEFVDGENLLQELKRSGRFSEAKIKDLLLDLLPVLQFIHTGQVIHRDIKPENVIRRRSDGKLVLVDFGAAKVVTKTNLGKLATFIGTGDYAAPEQLSLDPRFASDIYSLGVTCIYLLTQIEPKYLFCNVEFQWVWRQFLNGAKVNAQLGQILDRMIEKPLGRRYENVTEILQILQPTFPTKIQAAHSNPLPNISSNITTIQSYRSVTKLISSKGINYRDLEKLLQNKEWRKADELTAKLMWQIAKRDKEGYLREEDIQQFPCEDLWTIDQLWVNYSNNKFGFSIQQNLWLECGGKIGKYDYEVWKIFVAQTVWNQSKGRKWITYNEFMEKTNNALNALPASLPLKAGESPSMDVMGVVRLFNPPVYLVFGCSVHSVSQKLLNCSVK